MKKIIPLIFSVLYVITSNAQAVGGWGTCEFADVATMNAFDPSTNAYDCKNVFVQATNEHYNWNGTIWVLVADTDDQNASEVPFTPVGTIVATDVQAAIAEIEPDIYGSIDVHDDVDITTTAPSNGDLLSWDGSNFVPSSTDNGYTVFNIFAEESSSLDAGARTEWSFGNGDETPNGHGIVIPVDCELFAMSLDHEGGVNTIVRIIQNTDASLATYQISNSGTEQSHVTFGTPLSFTAGDIANFTTISSSSTGTSGRVSAWFRIRATPASTSLVNDMLDVSAGAIANGDILYFDGSSFVPLTLNAANVPYDNAISGLTASDVKAAIDELASGSSSDNIYNTDGTIDANRTVTLDGNDITFNGTGTGDVIIEAGGDVGIGTLTPDARFDVEGGTVKFSDYGTGANTGTETYLLAVDADGDIIETPLVTNTDAQTLSLATNTLSISGGNSVDLSGLADNLGDHTATQALSMSTNDIDFTTGDVNFGSNTRQMVNLYSSSYGIGIQSSTQYYRTGGHFAWYGGGSHDNSALNNGGGSTMMILNSSGNLGIGINPTSKFHVYEETGTAATATAGSILLEHNNSGGSSSIVFQSKGNEGSDYGFIEYSDDGSGNGSDSENSLLTIGVQNDGPGHAGQDDIAILPSGNLGVGTISPDALLDVEGGNVRFSDYGAGTITGTATQILGVDVDGDVIEVDPSSLGGSSDAAIGTIYIDSGDESTNNLSLNTPVKANGTTTLINANDVDMPANNRLRYTGSSTQTFFVSCNIAARVHTNQRQINYFIRKNGVDVPSVKTATHFRDTNASTEKNSTTITGTVELTTNDYLELWIENTDDGADVTVYYMNFSMFSINGGGGSGGSGDNIYSADGTLSTDRAIDLDGNDLTFDATSDMIIKGDGSVGIGTTTPDALFDVEGGTIRFSDYGAGTNSGTTTYILGVDVDGDIIEVDPASLGGGGGSNIYNADGTLGGDRTVTMDGNDLLFDSGSGSNFTIDGFTGSTSANPIFQIDRNGDRDLKFFHENDISTGYWNIATIDGIALEVDNTDGSGIYLEYTGDVGIGTSTPDRKLDVEGGQVRFSDYGTGTYEDTTAVYLLGVEADGDLIEMNTAKNSRIFYPPAIAIVADVVDTDLEIDLHDTYVELFEGSDPSFVKSTSAPGAIPTYDQDELYYYILDYDTSVFANVTIDDNGLMEYDVIAVASDNCSFINVVFVVKEP